MQYALTLKEEQEMNKTILVAALLSTHLLAVASDTQATAEAKLKADFIAFVNSSSTLPNAGDFMQWAGGVIVRNAQRQLIYTTSENGFAQFNLTQMTANPAELLKFGGQGVKRLWANTYGIDTSRIQGVQSDNAMYWTAVLVGHQPYGRFELGGNGSVTAIVTLDRNGNCHEVGYDGKVTDCISFQKTNWFRSLTGSPGLY